MSKNGRTDLTQDARSDPDPTSGTGDDPIFSPARLRPSQIDIAQMIVDQSRAAGINPAFMLSLAVTESSLRPDVEGDDGISIGLFQLNIRFQQTLTADELKNPKLNIQIAVTMMDRLHRQWPGRTFGDYAEAWTLGGTGKFVRGRSNPTKLTAMQRAIDDLELELDLMERWP